MIEREFVMKNKLGLHARPAALFVHEACRFKSSIHVSKDGLEINGKSVMGLMLLAAEKGSKLKIRAEGSDEKQAIEGLEKLFERKFDEE
ncbi:MAG: HPr family phosphocarrier protein [Elusimicrobia bacterium]|nr:HPr family phosphocarrier protein [Elusimicrobiota bacterium]